MEFIIGAGLACLGIAVGLGQWLIPPDKLRPRVRYTLVAFACVSGVIGTGLIVYALFPHSSTQAVSAVPAPVKVTPAQSLPRVTWDFSPEICEARTDSTLYLKFRDEYKIAVVCGIDRSGVDRYEDRSVSVSEAFTITNNPISISVMLNEKTLQAFADEIAKQKKTPLPSTPPAVLKRNLSLKLSHWGQLVLLPKSVTSDKIKTLSDVPVYKGKILSPEDF